jgi:hypothetical protein
VVNLKKLSKTELVLQLITCTVLTSYIFQNVFIGLNFGDPMDGTLQMVLHEHWYKVITHKESFLNTNFYFPFERALGYSDTFLFQGPIHTILRLIGIKIDFAWSITTFITIYVGNLGWILVARNLLKNKILRILFIVLCIFNYSFVAYVASQPNAASYALLSYFVYFAIKINESFNKNVKKFNNNFFYFVSLLSLMSLNNWYLTYFVLQILLFYCVMILINKFMNKSFFSTLQELNNNIITKYLIFSGICLIISLASFGYIYFPNRNDGVRNTSDLISRSPVIENIFNGSYPKDGGLFRSIYVNLGFINDKDNLLGVGLVYGIIFFLIIFQLSYQLIKAKMISKQIKSFELLFISVALSYCTFLVFNNSYSLFSLFYEVIPGIQSIRDTYRFNIVLNYAILMYLFLKIDTCDNSKKSSKNIFIILISFVLIIDQFRFPVKGWSPESIENRGLNSQLSELKRGCDYFYFDAPGGWWYDQAVAMKFSSINGIPTTNGNSGAFPPGYPYLDFEYEGDISGMVSWISKVNPSLTGCITNGELPIYFLNSKIPRFDLESGFTGPESINSSYWQWAISNKAFAYVYSPSGKDISLNFNISSGHCNEGGSLEIKSIQNEKLTITNISKNKTNVDYTVNMGNQKINKIEFTFNMLPCRVENDTRELFFKVSEYKII